MIKLSKSSTDKIRAENSSNNPKTSKCNSSICVDFSCKIGAVKPMHCVNNGPIDMPIRGISNFELFVDAGIPYSRLHDSAFDARYGGDFSVDVHRIFRNFDADETDPDSYKFAATDQYVATLIKAGIMPFYRLGAAIEHYQKDGTYPPKDYKKWARICEHIIHHYNEGWANGYNYGIEYWEIWNEADLDKHGINPCWQGTEDEFVEFFIVAMEHLKGCFPNLKIGGPAFSSPWKLELNKKLFVSLKSKNISLDFFSFHGYCSKPSQYNQLIETAKKQLDAFEFYNTEIILNEWNYVRGWQSEEWVSTIRSIKSLKGASFTVGTMCIVQSTCLNMFMYYDARPSAMNGMFNTDLLYPLKGYYPFKMFNMLYRLGNSVSSISEVENVYVSAAKGEDSYALILTYFDDVEEAEDKNIVINLKGLTNSQALKISFYLLDNSHDIDLVYEEHVIKKDIHLSLKLFDSYMLVIQMAL